MDTQDNLIEELFASYHDSLQHLCMNYFLYKPEYMHYVDDCIQDVFLAAWKKRSQLITHPNPYAWLANACKKQCAAIMRRKAIILKIFGSQKAFEEQHMSAQLQDDILYWITKNDLKQQIDLLRSRLTAAEDSTFTDYFVEGKTVPEISVERNCTQTSIYGTIQRIRKKSLKLDFLIVFIIGQFNFWLSRSM